MERPRPYTKSEVDLMVLMWDDGATIAEISDAIDRPRGSVGAYMTRNRSLFRRRKTRVYRWMLEDVGIMWDFGIPLDDIAHAMGMTHGEVHNLVYKSMRFGFCRPRRPNSCRRVDGERKPE